MDALDLKHTREDLALVRAWIETWQGDVQADLKPTETSLQHAAAICDVISARLARIEAETKEPA